VENTGIWAFLQLFPADFCRVKMHFPALQQARPCFCNNLFNFLPKDSSTAHQTIDLPTETRN
jgi:hypothetical protein